MIVGVGIDVVDVARFEQTLQRTPGLLTRLFTDAERHLPINSLAASFAAKEALAKSLGAPAGLRWTDAWVRRDDGRATASARAGHRGRPGRRARRSRRCTCRCRTTPASRRPS